MGTGAYKRASSKAHDVGVIFSRFSSPLLLREALALYGEALLAAELGVAGDGMVNPGLSRAREYYSESNPKHPVVWKLSGRGV